MTKEKFHQESSLKDDIALIVRERILDGSYKIGEKIVEATLANELRVSRTPIREAFSKLAEEGLIENIPNRGSFAKGFTKRDVHDIYEVRKSVESLAIEWAVERINEEEINKLEEIVEMMEFYTFKRNHEKVLETNREFHDVICKASESRFLSQILKSYQEYVQQARKTTVYEPEYLEAILKEHRDILASIKSKNSQEAIKTTRQHLDNSRKRTEAKWKGLSNI